jgi:hypothetical protein
LAGEHDGNTHQGFGAIAGRLIHFAVKKIVLSDILQYEQFLLQRAMPSRTLAEGQADIFHFISAMTILVNL